MNGTSLLYTFDDADAPERHTTQYFEVIANQGIYHDGWMANTTPKRLPWVGPRASPTRSVQGLRVGALQPERRLHPVEERREGEPEEAGRNARSSS